ncbi:MAG: MOSC domain-containing protein [Halobacteriota archaeon]
MATLSRIFLFPVKSLDAREVDSVHLVPDGGLDGDREYAIVDEEGRYVNGKRTRLVHGIQSTYSSEGRSVHLDAPGRDSATFDLVADREAAASWFGSHFDQPVELRSGRRGGFPDDTDASGPTVISTATLEAVASWFPGIDTDGMRRRLRANLEIDGVPAFWEDRLFSAPGEVVIFEIGGVRFHGVNPCQRCVVPSRDPDTGEEYDGFRERFVQQRRATMPSWSGGDWFDHDYRVMVNTRVVDSSADAELTVGDGIRIVDTQTDDAASP